MDLINLSIIGRKCGTVKKTPRWTYQSLLLRKTSFVLMFSSTLTARETIKWIAIHILIGKTILTKSGMVKNNKNSMKVEYSNIVILLFLDVVFIFIFNFTFLLLNVYNYVVITTDFYYTLCYKLLIKKPKYLIR